MMLLKDSLLRNEFMLWHVNRIINYWHDIEEINAFKNWKLNYKIGGLLFVGLFDEKQLL